MGPTNIRSVALRVIVLGALIIGPASYTLYEMRGNLPLIGSVGLFTIAGILAMRSRIFPTVLMIAAVASAVVPSVLSPSPSGSNRSLEQIAAELHRSQVRLYMTAGILAAGACISIWHSLRPSKLNRTLRGPDGTALDRM